MANFESYTYNDPRILYNEPYFYYIGSFNLVYLHGQQRRGKSGARVQTAPKTYPKPEMINLLFKTCVDYINNEKKENKCFVKNYKFKKNLDINLKIKNIKVQEKKRNLTFEVFSPKTIEKRLKTHVSSSLIFNKTHKINLKSKIFNKK